MLILKEYVYAIIEQNFILPMHSSCLLRCEITDSRNETPINTAPAKQFLAPYHKKLFSSPRKSHIELTVNIRSAHLLHRRKYV